MKSNTEKRVTETRRFRDGVLEVSDTTAGCYVRWTPIVLPQFPLQNPGPGWQRISEHAYSTIIELGGGWFYLTQYWAGLAEGMPIETPFRFAPTA